MGHYTLRAFLRDVPNDLLARYFESKSIPIDTETL